MKEIERANSTVSSPLLFNVSVKNMYVNQFTKINTK